MKVTNHTGLRDTKLTSYSPGSTDQICRGHEGDQPHWTERYQAHLILSWFYWPNLPWSWRWPTTLDWEIPSSPHTLLVLLTKFAVVMKVTNHTGLRDTKLTSYSPGSTDQICRGHEGDQRHWTERYQTHLILSWFYWPNLPWSWRWPTTLDWELPRSPHTLLVLLTKFAGVVKVTNHTGLRDTKLTSYSPGSTDQICRGHEGDQPHWTERYQAHLILSWFYWPNLPWSWRWPTTLDWEIPSSPHTLLVLLTKFAVVMKVTNHTGLRDTKLTSYSPGSTDQICRGHEGDQRHWTERYQTHLILSWFYWPNLPWSWRWPTTLDWEIPSSPHTLLVLLTKFVVVMKVTNHTGLRDTKLTSYSPGSTDQICRGHEGDQPHWTERYQAHLILSWFYWPNLPWSCRWPTTLDWEIPSSPHTLLVLLTNLPWSWRWPTTLDWEIPSSPHTILVLLTKFAVVMKVTNHTGLRDTKLTSYSPGSTDQICRGHEGDQPHWTERYQAHLIHSWFYWPNLPWSWRWPTTLDWEIPSSPHTLLVLLTNLPCSWRWPTTLDWEIPSSPHTILVLLTKVAVVMKVTNHTGLRNTKLTSYSPGSTDQICRGHEGDQPHWTERYQAHLILSLFYWPNLPWSWRWPTTLDWEIPSSPHTLLVLLTKLAVVMKVTNHTGLRDTKLTSYSPGSTDQICRGHEGDQPHWTERYQAHLILSWFYWPNLPWSWRWPTTLDWEMPSSPHTLLVLLTKFAVFMKVTNHTGLRDTKLTSYYPGSTDQICRGHEGDQPHWTERYQAYLILSWFYWQICRGHEGDQPHWTERYQAHLILSWFYWPNLPWSCRWPTTLDWEIPSSPHTLLVLLTKFAVVMKVTNHTGLRDTKLTSYSPGSTDQICRGHVGDQPHWTERYQAHLIHSWFYWPNLPWSWRWPTTLDWEIPSSPHTLLVLLTKFAVVMKVTNHTGLRDTKLTSYTPGSTDQICHGHEGDQPHWTERYQAHLILSWFYWPNLPGSWRWPTTLDWEIPSLPHTLLVLLTKFAVVMKVTNRNRLWNAELAWYSPRATHQIYFYGLEYDFEFHNLLADWHCLTINLLASRVKYHQLFCYVAVIYCTFIFRMINVFGDFQVLIAQFEPVKLKFQYNHLTSLNVRLSNYTQSKAMHNLSAHQLPRYYHNHSRYLSWLELLRPRDIPAAN